MTLPLGSEIPNPAWRGASFPALHFPTIAHDCRTPSLAPSGGTSGRLIDSLYATLASTAAPTLTTQARYRGGDPTLSWTA